MTAGAKSTAAEGTVIKDNNYFALGTVWGLARYHPTEIKPAVDTLETHLTDTGPHREVVAGALAHYYVAAGEETSLRELFDDDGEAVRRQAIDSMKRAAKQTPADVAAVLEVVEPLLVPPDVNTEADRRIRQAAVETIQRVAAETPRAAASLLEPLSQIRDADTEAQSAVEQAISRIETANHELSDFME
jgi:hypothetical protein